MMKSERSSQYFDAKPSVASHPRTVELTLSDMRLTLTTDRGVFAGSRIDRGTNVLLQSVPLPPPSGEILDLGCGYGPIALTIARRVPDARVWAIDVNERALELVRKNASDLGVHNVMACLPDEVPDDLRWSAIYSNPPVRIGKTALHDLLVRWLDCLLPEGRSFLVVQKHLGSDSLCRWLNEQGYPTRRIRSKNAYRILETHSPCPR